MEKLDELFLSELERPVTTSAELMHRTVSFVNLCSEYQRRGMYYPPMHEQQKRMFRQYETNARAMGIMK